MQEPLKSGYIGRVRSIWTTIRLSPNPWRHFLALAIKRTGLWRWVTIRGDGYRLRFFPSASMVHLYADPALTRDNEEFLRRVLASGDLVVDVGANIGAVTLAACNAVGSEGHVIAIEPHPLTFRHLQENLALNGMDARRVTALNTAIGDASGFVSFSNMRWNALNHVTTAGDGIRIPVARLDDLLAGYGHIAVLKIDTEGYECFVLDGAHETLARTRYVFFEYGEALYARFGRTLSEALAVLHAHGFSVHLLDHGQVGARVSAEVADSVVNLVALRGEKV